MKNPYFQFSIFNYKNVGKWPSLYYCEWVTVMDGFKFEFSDIISLYKTNDSERKRSVSLRSVYKGGMRGSEPPPLAFYYLSKSFERVGDFPIVPSHLAMSFSFFDPPLLYFKKLGLLL